MRFFGNRKGSLKRKDKEAIEKIILEEKVKIENSGNFEDISNNGSYIESVENGTAKVTNPPVTYAKPQTFSDKNCDEQVTPVNVKDSSLDDYFKPYKITDELDKKDIERPKKIYIPPKKIEYRDLVVLVIDGSDNYFFDVELLNSFFNDFCKKIKDSMFLKILKIEDDGVKEEEIVKGEFLDPKFPFEPYNFLKLSNKPVELFKVVTLISKIIKDYTSFQKKIELEQYSNKIFKIENVNIFIFSNCVDKDNDYEKIRKTMDEIKDNRKVQSIKCFCVTENDMIHVAAEMGIRNISFLGM